MKQTLDLTIQGSTSLTTSFAGIPFEVARYNALSIQILLDFTGGATSAGVFAIEQSNDGAAWSQSGSSIQPITNANTNLIWNIPVITSRYLRVVYTNTAGTGGTCITIGHATL